MERLKTIQKRDKLNTVFRMGEEGPGGAYHDYLIMLNKSEEASVMIEFQRGARKDPDARHGVLDEDLLEIVRDRLRSFQLGEFATRENALALTHIEEALLWLNKRKEDRAERGVLGTMEV